MSLSVLELVKFHAQSHSLTLQTGQDRWQHTFLECLTIHAGGTMSASWTPKLHGSSTSPMLKHWLWYCRKQSHVTNSTQFHITQDTGIKENNNNDDNKKKKTVLEVSMPLYDIDNSLSICTKSSWRQWSPSIENTVIKWPGCSTGCTAWNSYLAKKVRWKTLETHRYQTGNQNSFHCHTLPHCRHFPCNLRWLTQWCLVVCQQARKSHHQPTMMTTQHLTSLEPFSLASLKVCLHV